MVQRKTKYLNLFLFCQESSPCAVLSHVVSYCYKNSSLKQYFAIRVLILAPIITLPLRLSSLLLNKVAMKMEPIFILTMAAEVCS